MPISSFRFSSSIYCQRSPASLRAILGFKELEVSLRFEFELVRRALNVNFALERLGRLQIRELDARGSNIEVKCRGK